MVEYGYSDETEFMQSATDVLPTIGSGLLVINKPVTESIIKEALNELDKDSDKNEIDLKTLSRGYFHASEDSKNAHSHLCKSIVKNLTGYFRYSFFNLNKASVETLPSAKERFRRLTLKIASLGFFSDEAKEVFLTIESRNNFVASHAKIWLEQFFDEFDRMAYDQPSFFTYYPNIHLNIVGKINPGIQIVDFLLWSLNRANKEIADLTWLNRLELRQYTWMHDEEKFENGGIYHLNNYKLKLGKLNYPFTSKDIQSENDLLQIFSVIETVLQNLVRSKLPPHVEHLKFLLLSISSYLNGSTKLTETTLHKICSTFIRFFDTLPIYQELNALDKEKWELLLQSKKLCGLLLHKHLLHSVRTADFILNWKNSNY